ncbi:MAG: N-acetylmuramoyl-L-alanine amidase [Acidimicrobiia bacterium]|nr:N-acetylmuramoyl-L-alanine amidase [Acidimicrobiia bacterium]
MRRLLPMTLLVVLVAGCTAQEDPAGGEVDLTTSTGPSTTTTTVPATTTSSTTTTSTTTTTTTTTTLPPVPYGVPTEPMPGAPAPAPLLTDDFAGTGVVTVAAGGAPLRETPDAEPFVVAREGLVFAARQMQGDWIEVFTSCDASAWVEADDVLARPPAPPAEVGAGFDFADAVIVIDPGHGGPWNIGASSPAGLAEKTVNLDIAQRVRDLLAEPRSVDWATGEIYYGTEIAAANWVILTRVGAGEDGDYEAGLFYRTSLANAANAHAMVAIHNNAGWEVRLDHPGSDVYYQSQIPESRRFAKIMVEELRRGFASFEADWVGAVENGAKSRLSPREGHPQYYGILRHSEMPTVIAEGVYIANQSEADLLATAEFRQAYADAVYRALVRFLTTDDTGESDDSDPEIWYGDAGSGDARPQCEVPSQD